MADTIIVDDPQRRHDALPDDSDSSGDSKLHTIMEQKLSEVLNCQHDRRDSASPLVLQRDAKPPYSNPYYSQQRDYSPSVIPPTPPKTRISSWMDAILRTPAGDEKEEVPDDDDFSVDSIEELEEVALRIRSEIRNQEMQELAVEAEQAAEAGLESFAGRASTFGDASNDLPAKPKLKRYRTYSEGGSTAGSLLQASTLQASLTRRINTRPKIRVLALRHINEVIPQMSELHSHLRTHLVLNGVDPQSLQASALEDDERTRRKKSVTPVQFLNSLTSWVSKKPSSGPHRFASTALDDNDRCASPDSLVGDNGEQDVDTTQLNFPPRSSFDAYEVGGKLSGHIHAPVAVRRSPIRLPSGLDLPDDLDGKWMLPFPDDATVGTMPTSSSSMNGQDTHHQQQDDQQSSSRRSSQHDLEQFTPVALFGHVLDEQHDDSPQTAGSSSNSLLDSPLPTRDQGMNRSHSASASFVTPNRLRDIRHSPKPQMSRGMLHEASNVGWTLKARNNMVVSHSNGSSTPKDESAFGRPWSPNSELSRVQECSEVSSGNAMSALSPPLSLSSEERFRASDTAAREESLQHEFSHAQSAPELFLTSSRENRETPTSLELPDLSHGIEQAMLPTKRQRNKDETIRTTPPTLQETTMDDAPSGVCSPADTVGSSGKKKKSSSVVIRVIEGSGCNGVKNPEFVIREKSHEEEKVSSNCEVTDELESDCMSGPRIEISSAKSPPVKRPVDEVDKFYSQDDHDQCIDPTDSPTFVRTEEPLCGLQMSHLEEEERRTPVLRVSESDPITTFYSKEDEVDNSIQRTGSLVIELGSEHDALGDNMVRSDSLKELRKAAGLIIQRTKAGLQSRDENDGSESAKSVDTPPPNPCECLVAAASSVEQTMTMPPRFDSYPPPPVALQSKSLQHDSTLKEVPHHDHHDWIASTAGSSSDSLDVELPQEALPPPALTDPWQPCRRTTSCPSLVALGQRPVSPANPATTIHHKGAPSEQFNSSPKSAASDKVMDKPNRRQYSFRTALSMDPCQSTSPFKETMDDMIKNLSPKSGEDDVEKATSAVELSQENHDFLNNYLYCSKPPGRQPSVAADKKKTADICGVDGCEILSDVRCEILSGVLDTYRAIVPTKRPTSHVVSLDAGGQSIQRFDNDNWFDNASEKFDSALEKLVGRAHAQHSRWNSMFQAPSLKTKKENGPSTPVPNKSVKGIILVKQSSSALESDPELSDQQFQYLYGMPRETFSSLPVTERSLLHDMVNERRSRWMSRPNSQAESTVEDDTTDDVLSTSLPVIPLLNDDDHDDSALDSSANGNILLNSF